MFLIRRAAFRTLSTSTPILAKTRSISATAPAILKAQQQWLKPSLQARFYSQEPTTFTETAASQSETPAADEVVVEAPQTRPKFVDGAGSVFNNKDATPAEPSTNLYVGNLFFDVTEDQLRSVFSKFGSIEQARVIYDQRGLSRGFGFVRFENVEDAAAAIENLNQQVFEGRRLVVQFHKHRPRERSRMDQTTPSQEHPPSQTLYIGNMSFEISDKDIHDLFRDIRNCIEVRIAADRKTNKFRGFCHADFIDVASATKAKEQLDNKELYGRGLRIDYSLYTPRYLKRGEKSEQSPSGTTTTSTSTSTTPTDSSSASAEPSS